MKRRKVFGGPMLYLKEADVRKLLTMQDALREVEAALRDLGEGRAENRPRQRVRGAHSVLNIMPGSWPARGYSGFKYYTVARTGSRFWFHLFDGTSGALLAILEANRLGQQRTGAASGVATKLLARGDASIVGVLGTGWQAESQLEAMCAVRSVREVRCYSRDASHSAAFAQKLASLLGTAVRPVESGEAAVRGSDIVVTATNSAEPVVRGAWLDDGVHINAMGANRLESRELDDDTIRRASLVVADSIEQARSEAGDLVQPAMHALLRWESVRDLGSVVAGKAPGRVRPDEVTIFKSLGLAIEDVAVGAFVYERALKEGLGTETDL